MINKINDKSIIIIFSKEIDGPNMNENGITPKRNKKKLSICFVNIIK